MFKLFSEDKKRIKIQELCVQNTTNYNNTNYSKSSSVFVNDARLGGRFKNLETSYAAKFTNWEISTISEKLNNFKVSDLYFFIENSVYIFLDFLIIGNFNSLIYVVLFTALLNKLYTIFKKMISHERSKKLYFFFYLSAISYILGQCLILVTSNNSNTSDQGILLLYIYVTATLMLFLIFLALTTCESYLYKEKDNGYFSGKISPIKIIVNSFILFFIVTYYHGLMAEVVDVYYTKLAILTGLETKLASFDITTYNSNLNKYGSLYKVNTNNWSIFDGLKFDIIDNYTNYILSAVLQMCALIIVILSLVM